MLADSFAMLSKIDPKESVSLRQLHEILGEDGAALIIVFLCIPFLFPVPIPGISTMFGMAIIMFTFAIIFPKRVYLPSFMERFTLKGAMIHSIGERGVKFTSRFEKFLRPRLPSAISNSGKGLIALAMISSAIALALPIPPVIPFTNTLPALAICAFALALMMKDGLAAIVGHVLHLVSWAYLLSVASIAFAFTKTIIDYISK